MEHGISYGFGKGRQLLVHLQGTRKAGRARTPAGDMITAAAVLTATRLRTLLAVRLGRTDLGASLARIALGALALARKGLAGGIVQTIALQLAVDAVQARRTI